MAIDGLAGDPSILSDICLAQSEPSIVKSDDCVFDLLVGIVDLDAS